MDIKNLEEKIKSAVSAYSLVVKKIVLENFYYYDLESLFISPKHEYNDEGLYSYRVSINDADIEYENVEDIQNLQDKEYIEAYDFGQMIEEFLNDMNINSSYVEFSINQYEFEEERRKHSKTSSTIQISKI